MRPRRDDLLDDYHKLSGDELSDRIMQAGAAELEVLLRHPRIAEKQIVLALANPRLPAALIREIGDDRRWTKSYDVKHALVRHRRTPRHIAVRYVKFLYLAHLTGLLDDHAVVPGVKRVAATLLAQRMPQVTLGERLTMARCGGRGVIASLLSDETPEVQQALLQNPKLSSRDVVSLLDSSESSPRLFHEVFQSRRWSREYRVRTALARNPRCPRSIALGVLSGLMRQDLRSLVSEEETPRLIRLAAEKVLSAREPKTQMESDVEGEPESES